MGNTVPPRMCREAAGGRRRPKNVAAEAATARKLRRRGGEEEEEEGVARAGHRRAVGVSRAGDDVGKAPAGTVVKVKIVMRRKDAEALVARLNAQSARERKARMAELKGELRDGDCGGASPASCRDAWRPKLVPIQEC